MQSMASSKKGAAVLGRATIADLDVEADAEPGKPQVVGERRLHIDDAEYGIVEVAGLKKGALSLSCQFITKAVYR